MGILAELFIAFFKIGMFSFGGGYAMVAVIQKEVALKGWLSAAEYARVVTVAQMSPGPIAVNIATYVGTEVCKASPLFSLAGALTAALGVAMPSFIIMLLVAGSLQKIKSSKEMQWVMGGIRPAVIGFMLAAVIFFGKLAFWKGGAQVTSLGSLVGGVSFPGVFIAVTAFLLHYRLGWGTVRIILVTGLAGLLLL